MNELERCAAALERWRSAFESFTRPGSAPILAQLAAAAPGSTVVDLACGIGDPALALAAALPGCRIVACDRVAPFLQQLAAEAGARGLHNLTPVCCDLAELPLPAATADWVVSRFGLQFASDVPQALREITRVLRPGGRTLHVVWGSPDQPFFRLTLSTVLEACGAPVFAVGEPGPFQFAAADALARQLRAAGFGDVCEAVARDTWTWPGDAESLWASTLETSAPMFEPLLASLGTAARGELEARVVDGLRAFDAAGTLAIPIETRWISAAR
ncbi:MAG TPA: methyltransferase domain-containing protein [Polyangiales bacterium]|nr:methyltransferase domain-containing protein [Polyangiales bacterium]